jgi:hypothetical protein
MRQRRRARNRTAETPLCVSQGGKVTARARVVWEIKSSRYRQLIRPEDPQTNLRPNAAQCASGEGLHSQLSGPGVEHLW